MNIATIKQAFYTWLTAESGNQNVIWAKQNTPQPQRPFFTLFITGMEKEGEDYETLPDEDGVRKIIGTRTFDLEIEFLGTKSGIPDNASVPVDGVTRLEQMMNTILKQENLYNLRAADVIILDREAVQDLSDLEDSHFLTRAKGIIKCRSSMEVVYGGDTPNTSIIEIVNIDYDVEDRTGTINVDGGA